MKSCEAKAFFKLIQIENPKLISDCNLQKPTPIIKAMHKLPSLLNSFCSFKELKQPLTIEDKTLFVAVIIKLYNPDLLTGLHGDRLKDNLCYELSDILKWNLGGVSHAVNNIRRFLDPFKTHKAYGNFRKEVDDVFKHLCNRKESEKGLNGEHY